MSEPRSEPDPGSDSAPEDERVSLYPLDPIEALKAALRVNPKSDPVEDEDGN